MTGVVIGPDDRPVPDVPVSISGTVVSDVRTDEKGRFTLPIPSGSTIIQATVAGIETAARVRIVQSLTPSEVRSEPPPFTQPGERINLNGDYTRAQYERSGQVADTPVATSITSDGSQAVSSYRVPTELQPGEVTWTLTDANKNDRGFRSNVYRIVTKWIDEQRLVSYQRAEFRYRFDFGQQMAGREVWIEWNITGPVDLRSRARQPVRISSDGYADVSGRLQARRVPPGTEQPFTLTPIISSTR